MKISTELSMTLMAVLVIFGYVQGVVVPNTAVKYAEQAAVANTYQTPTQKMLPPVSPCNPVQSKCGKLLIRKDTQPNNYQNFTFVHQTIPGYTQTFILDDDFGLPNASTMSNIATFYTPYNATFLVAEVVNASYSVTVVCTDPSGGTIVDGSIAFISVSQGESITCTFKNIHL